VNLGVVVVTQSGPFVVFHHSTPNHAIGPKTKDKDDNDLDDPMSVATLTLGSRPRQRGCKVVGQEEVRESHRMFPGM